MKFFKLLLTYLSIFVFFSALYILAFRSPLFLSDHVLFYRGVKLLFITVFATFIVFLIFSKKLKLNLESLIAAVAISFAFHLSFFVIFPVTFERSVTMFLLNTLNESPKTANCTGYYRKDLENKLVQDYVIKNKAIEKRVAEQSVINFVNENDKQCISITPRAVSFIDFSKIIKKLYKIDD